MYLRMVALTLLLCAASASLLRSVDSSAQVKKYDLLVDILIQRLSQECPSHVLNTYQSTHVRRALRLTEPELQLSALKTAYSHYLSLLRLCRKLTTTAASTPIRTRPRPSTTPTTATTTTTATTITSTTTVSVHNTLSTVKANTAQFRPTPSTSTTALQSTQFPPKGASSSATGGGPFTTSTTSPATAPPSATTVPRNTTSHTVTTSTTSASSLRPRTSTELPTSRASSSDPCYSPYTMEFDESWRKDPHGLYLKPNGLPNCDMGMSGYWFRFSGDAGSRLADSCRPDGSCGTNIAIWSDDVMPTQAGEEKSITAYASYTQRCKWRSIKMTARKCSDKQNDFLYRLDESITHCNQGFCSMD